MEGGREGERGKGRDRVRKKWVDNGSSLLQHNNVDSWQHAYNSINNVVLQHSKITIYCSKHCCIIESFPMFQQV